MIPHIDVFLDFFHMEVDSVIYKIQKAINNNLIKKEKGSKNLIDLEKTVEDINKINLFVRRSFSAHLWSWMNDSARFI